ncbi:hypothetical protein G6O67_005477 [Ophiocordyceps sinensis]|uniref:Uncharacterized protein n=1 Tax=Ophiocordyceps sinensis TaxID=72228 RepID=A0A8H4PRL4_9HYPO|nr:hypothetical protein G6O67_005477 [Ophiocordyceps sinensis]
MLSLANLVLAIAVLGAAPMGLAAPSPADDSLAERDFDAGVSQLEQRHVADDAVADADDVQGEHVLDVLQARASCYTTSQKGKNCHANQCPGRTQCKVNNRGRCVWAKPKRQRPFGCGQCRCAKFT